MDLFVGSFLNPAVFFLDFQYDSAYRSGVLKLLFV